jgi:hypothetical protein
LGDKSLGLHPRLSLAAASPPNPQRGEPRTANTALRRLTYNPRSAISFSGLLFDAGPINSRVLLRVGNIPFVPFFHGVGTINHVINETGDTADTAHQVIYLLSYPQEPLTRLAGTGRILEGRGPSSKS